VWWCVVRGVCPEFGYGTAKVGSAPAALGSAPAAPAAARLDRERRRRRRVLRTRTRTRTSGRGSALSPSVAGAAVAERPPPPPRNQRHGAVGDGKRRVPAPWRHVRRWRPGLSAAKPPAPCAMTPGAAGRSAAGASLLTRRRRYGSASSRALGGLQDSKRFFVRSNRDGSEILAIRQIARNSLRSIMLRGCVPRLCSSMLIYIYARGAHTRSRSERRGGRRCPRHIRWNAPLRERM
jgi:hypothetical protein